MKTLLDQIQFEVDTSQGLARARNFCNVVLPNKRQRGGPMALREPQERNRHSSNHQSWNHNSDLTPR